MELWHALVIEWDFATYQHIQDDAKTPNVDFGTSVLLRLQQLRRRKVQASTKGLQVATWRKQIAQAKVNNLDVSSFTDQYVLNFEISVHNTVSMTIIERTRNLTSKFPGVLLF